MSIHDELHARELQRLRTTIARLQETIREMSAQRDAWFARAGTGHEIARRLKELPDFKALFSLKHITVCCPLCKAVQWADDFGFDLLRVQSPADIVHAVGENGTETVRILLSEVAP